MVWGPSESSCKEGPGSGPGSTGRICGDEHWGINWNLAGGVLRELDEQQGCEEDGDAERKEAGEALKHLEGLGRRAGSGVERLDSRY